MAIYLPITFPSTFLQTSIIRRSALDYPRNSRHFTPMVFPYNTKKICRFFHPILLAAGSSGIASIASDEDITSSLETVEVYDLTGKAVPILDLWIDRKAVVAFARHFGCVLCRKRADVLASKKEKSKIFTIFGQIPCKNEEVPMARSPYRDLIAGVTLVLIAPGTVDQAIAFCDQTQFKGEVYADPTHSSFDAFNFAHGVSTIFTPKAGMKIIESYLEGYRQDWGLSFKENTMNKGGWQQGGILVAGPGTGNISYLHKDKEAGDDPNIEDVLQACCS